MVKRIVLTGGPGSGKSSLLKALEARHFRVCPEISRILIREELNKKKGVLPWTNMRDFAERCLDRMVKDWERVAHGHDDVFYDRGIPDIIAYVTLSKLQPSERLMEVVARKRYHPVVFWCPPWPEIYVNDAERPQTFPEAKALGSAIKYVYEKNQYQVVSMPKVPVQQRADFVLQHLRHDDVSQL